MATSVSLDGGSTNFSIPATGDSGWGDDVHDYLVAISTNCLNKAGGTFTLAAEVNLGATYGLKVAYLKSQTANIATAGYIALAKTDAIKWRNNANGADLALAINASDLLTFGAIALTDISTAQTLTNKSMSGSANTFTNLPLATAVTGTLPVLNGGTGTTTAQGSGSVVLSTGATITSAALVTPTVDGVGIGFFGSTSGTSILRASAVAGGSMVIPSGTDTLVAAAQTQTLQNKTFIAPVLGVATGTSLSLTGTAGVGFLELQEQSATPSSPASTKLRIYGKTTDEGLYFLNSSGTESQVGSGSGEKNYLATGANTQASWTASGLTIGTDVTGTNLPRPNTTKTALKITGGSSTANYAYYRFILDDADAGKKLKFQFDMKPGTAVASDFEVAVYSNTASDYTTGNTRLSLSTDSSSVSALPALTGTYRTTFDAPATTAKWLEVRIKEKTSNAHTLYVSDIVVGPGVVTQGAAVSEWVAYTPTVSNLGTGSTTSNAGKWRRVGDTMEVHLYTVKDGSGGSGTSVVTWSLPTGYTIDTTKLQFSGSVTENHIGTASSFGLLAASQYDRALSIYNASTTTVAVIKPTTTTGYKGSDFAASTEFSLEFTVPIAEWSGSGTVNIGAGEIEYVSNSNVTAATTTDTSAYVTGPGGSALLTGTPAGDSVTRQVQWLTPIQAGDSIILEVSANGSTWCVGSANILTAGYVEGLRFDGTNYIGIGLDAPGAAGATTSTVRIGKYRAGTTSTWDGTGKWRLVRFRGGQAVGFSEVQPGVSSGLVSASGVKGRTDGNAVAAGYVGEEMIQQRVLGSGTSATNATALNVTSTKLTLTPGEWEIMGTVCFNPAASTSITLLDAAISKTSATLPSSSTIGAPSGGESWTENGYAAFVPGAGNVVTLHVMPNRVTISANTDFYLVAKAGFTVSTMTVFGTIRARRIA